MGIPAATHQAAADAIKALGNYVSVHTGAGGGTTGANEATGGSYTRKPSVLTSGTGGVVTGSTVNVPVVAGTYTEGGLNSAATAGTFVGSAPFAGGSIVVNGTGVSIDLSVTWS